MEKETKLVVSIGSLPTELGNSMEEGAENCRNQRGQRTPGEHNPLNQVAHLVAHVLTETDAASMGAAWGCIRSSAYMLRL